MPPLQSQLTSFSSAEHPWMVKLGAFSLAASGLTGVCQICTTLVNTSSETNPIVAAIVSLFLFVWGGIEVITAWGVWKLNEMARNAFIVIVAINALMFLCGLSDIANESIWAAVLAAIFGLAFRGYFIYWFMDNPHYFVNTGKKS
jgi:hypothetical protein